MEARACESARHTVAARACAAANAGRMLIGSISEGMGMAHLRQTPAQKKQTDYAREGRNRYGEAPHGARKSIPRNKRFGNKSNRVAQLVELSSLRNRAGGIDIGAAEDVETELLGRRDARWRKAPDTPLGFVVAEKLAARGRREPVKFRQSALGGGAGVRAWPGGSPLDADI